ncbi:MAG TPA: SBBP repeat-containing protein [Bryobacteraceae bacterium]|nr:SBBP repeat-containing protein [Bryobacteraceae bacterium]
MGAAFEPNRGQASADVQYLLRSKSHVLQLRANDARVVLAGKDSTADVIFGLAGSAKRPHVVAEGQQISKTNYFVGNDSGKWVRNIARYSKVTYQSIYPGIDLVYYISGDQFEYDFVVHPGADPSRIRMKFQGSTGPRIGADGSLVLPTPAGDLIHKSPVIYQESGTQRQTINGSFKRRTDGNFGFHIASYDRRLPLIIDPVLTFASYIGGSGEDIADAMATDAAGNLYMAGDTISANFPISQGARSATFGGVRDIFIAKFSPSGTLIYSTIWGGSGGEITSDLAVDAAGNAVISGTTESTNVPTVDPVQARNNGGYFGFDAFLFRLNPTGSELLASTYLGGNDDELGGGVTIDREGSIYTTGTTASMNFPVTANVYQPTNRGQLDVFVVKLSPTGKAVVLSTFLGGTSSEIGIAIAVDPAGAIYVGGNAESADFPVSATAFQRTRKAGGEIPYDCFVAKLSPQGQSLGYATFLGGTGEDRLEDLLVDSEGAVYVAGFTPASDFPTTAGAVQTAISGPFDAFVTKVNPGGTALVYSTFLGGNRYEDAFGLAFGGGGTVWVTGTTQSTNFPTKDPLQQALRGSSDTFVTQLNAAGTGLLNSTYFGGSGFDFGYGIAADAQGKVTVFGETGSSDLTTGVSTSHQRIYGGGDSDSFIARIDFAAAPAQLTVSPARIDFAGSAGATVASQSVTITSPQGTNLAWTIEVSTTSGGNWLVANPNRGSGTASVAVFPQVNNLQPGTYGGTLTLVSTASGTRTAIPVSLTLSQASNQIPANGVVNGASFQSGGVAPGEVVTIYGTRIGPSALTFAQVNSSGFFATVAGETRVLFDNVPAPLIYSSENQISAIVPYAVAGKTTTQMQVEYRGTRSNAVALAVADASPAFFTAAANGRGQGAFLNENLTYNSASNPADKGAQVVLFATGEGQTTPTGIDGKLATDPYPKPRLPVMVQIGGQTAEVLYVGATPGQVAGLLQINARIPMNAPSGAEVPITLTVGGVSSPMGVTLAIR